MLDTSTDEYVCQAKNFKIIDNLPEAKKFFASLDPDEIYALDFETTALEPQDGSIRLTTIHGDGVSVMIDHWSVPFAPVATLLSQRIWWVFNSLFEGKWIDYYAENADVTLWDVQFLRKAKLGGGPTSLAKMAKSDLGYIMNKDEQNSDWARKELTPEQLVYAALDGVVTYELAQYWLEELTQEQWNGFLTINDAWRGTVEMQSNPLHVDVVYHQRIVTLWRTKHDTAERYLRKWTPTDTIANLRSRKQLSDFFKATFDRSAIAVWPRSGDGERDQLSTTSDTLRHIAHRTPAPINRWIAALLVFNYYEKYLNTYGDKLIVHMRQRRCIPSRYNMAQAVTCRYSSSKENLQNIPHSKVVRRSFTPLPLNQRLFPGMTFAEMEQIIKHFLATGELIKNIIVMVLADYSSIEVRTLAELADDDRLRQDAIYGDVHSRSASQIFRIDYDEFKAVIDCDETSPLFKHQSTFKDMRTRAKIFTFRLLYGAGAGTLAITLRCNDDQAQDAINAWAEVYPRAFHYRQYIFECMNNGGFIPVKDGRTIFVPKLERTMQVAANYPVQGAAASVLYRSIYHVNNGVRQLRKQANSIGSVVMRGTVHDENILYSMLSEAPVAKKVLADGMVRGWLDIFPGTDTANLVDAKIGASWGSK